MKSKPIAFRLSLLLGALFICCGLLAQSVRGLVTDDTNNPLQGVSVKVKGSSVAAITNEKGLYNIKASAGSTLVFTIVGFQEIETAVKGSTLNIRLEPATDVLSDVVVIGYGTQKKVNLTGAVSQIDGKALTNRPVTNALSALQGAAPGLLITRSYGQPGKEGWDATIRGFSSVNGNNNPLVIVDGVPGQLSTLNPNDVENISVLKDAAAASIYGAEAASGVIVVTTKSGKSQKLRVEYSGIFTANSPFNMPERNHSWVEAEQLNIARNNSGQSNSWSADQIRWFKSPDTNYLKNTSNAAAWDVYEDIDYVKMLMRKYTLSQQQNISVSGGNDKTTYMFSMGYYTQNGVFQMGPDAHKRVNVRLNLNTQFNKKVSLNSRLSYVNTNTLSPAPMNGTGEANGDYGLLYQLYQLRSIYPIFLPNDDGSTAGSYDKTKYFSGGIQTYADLLDGGSRQEGGDLFDAVFTLKATDIVKGLSVRAIYSPQLNVSTDNVFLRTIQYWNRTGVASYTNQTNSVTKGRALTKRDNIQFLLDYDYKTGRHGVHLLGGFQYNGSRYDNISARANNLISNDIRSLNFSANPALNTPTVGDNVQTRAFVSYFGRVNYNYDSKYLFEATLRQDASSQLAPGYRTNLFPSASVGWNMNKENWFPASLSFFDELKFRGSWGKLGNSSVLGNYDYYALLSRGGQYPFNNVINNSIFQGAYASEEKGWEVLESTNVGVDFQLFKRRLSGSFDYFVRKNSNMLITPTVPAIFGVSPAQRNDADLKTWGWEFELKWRGNFKKFNYWISANISDAQNKIMKYNGQNVYSSGTRSIMEGLPINTIWGYRSGGFFQNAGEVAAGSFQDSRTGAGDIRYLDLNKDGRINGGSNTKDDHGDLVMLGETTPHYSYGITLGFDWKGLDFSAFLQGVAQREMLIYSYAALPYMESWRQSWKIHNDYWTPENPNAKFPRLFLGGTHNGVTSDFWVQNASYLRLKNLQIGYTLPTSVTNKIGINKLRVFFTGQDLWETTGMWLNYYDPEQPNGANFGYPFFRSYAMGLNVTF